MDIDTNEMFQLITELQSDTVLLRRESTISNYVEWIREADGSYINWPERSMIDDLVKIGMLVTESVRLKNGEEATKYTLSDKSVRILRARELKNPTHHVPYSGEKCWLVIHKKFESIEVYPYLGVTPPDLSQLLPPDWEGQEYGETFTVRCLPLASYLDDKDFLTAGAKDA